MRSIDQAVTKSAHVSPVVEDGAAQSGNVFTNPLLHMSLLIMLTLFCFARTVTSYFLADDFGHIGVIRAIMQGTDLFWANFVGNFNQIPGMNVYRPLQLTTELLDYALFKGNAAGWYVANLVYFAAAICATYLLGRELFRAWGVWRSSLIGFLAASLLASSPLRCESVSWMVGRVDVIACLFYLISLYAFIGSKTVTGKCWAIASFVYAIGNKEMPVMLPIVVTSYYLFGLNETVAQAQVSGVNWWQPLNLWRRIKNAFVTSAPYWVTLAVYFAIRLKCLGTIGGGYVGGLGSSLPQMLRNWTDPDTLHRLFLPFNTAVAPEPNIYSNVLALCYIVVAILAVVRLLLGNMPWRSLAFVSVWIATCAIPIYSVWGLGYFLEGSRFYFFVSVPLSVMVALLALAPYAPGTDGSRSDLLQKLDRRATALGVVALILATVVLARVTVMTNAAWVHAGKEIRKFADACVHLSEQDPTKTFVILGIPEDHAGAHQLLNGRTFTKLFMPPFMQTDISDRFVNFLPMVYGPAELINASRLRDCLAKRQPVYLWSSETNKLTQLKIAAAADSAPAIAAGANVHAVEARTVSLAAQTAAHQVVSFVDGAIVMANVKADDGIRIDNLDLSTNDYDFLEFDGRFTGGAVDRGIQVSWTPTGQKFGTDVAVNCAHATLPSAAAKSGASSSDVRLSSLPLRHVRVRLSRYWRWFAVPRVGTIFIQPGVASAAEIRNIRLVASAQIAPQLSLVGRQQNNSGYLELDKAPITVRANWQSVQAAKKVVVEVSKPNFFFDRLDSGDDHNAVGATVPCTAADGVLTIDGAAFQKAFPGPGFYQLRAQCIGADGNPAGESSDPVSVHFSKSAW